MAGGGRIPDKDPGGKEEDSTTHTLELALSNPSFYTPFASFLEEEHNQENLLLWRAIREFEAVEGDARSRQGHAERIVARFIRSGAPLEVNMEESRRAEIGSAVRESRGSDIEAHLRLLKQTALQQMLVDSLPRFMRSRQWKSAVDAAGDESVSFDVSHGRRVTFSSSGHPRLTEATAEVRKEEAAKGGGGEVGDGVGVGGEGGGEEGGLRRPSTIARLAKIESLGFTSDGELRPSDLGVAASATRSKRLVMGFSVRTGLSGEQKEALGRVGAWARKESVVVREGFLEKRGDHHHTWKKRYFVLAAPGGKELGAGDESLFDFGTEPFSLPPAEAMPPEAQNGALVYFVSSDAGAEGPPMTLKGVIPLTDMVLLHPTAQEEPTKPFAFAITTTHGRKFLFAAYANAERRRWLRALCAVLKAKPPPK